MHCCAFFFFFFFVRGWFIRLWNLRGAQYPGDESHRIKSIPVMIGMPGYECLGIGFIDNPTTRPGVDLVTNQ